MHAGIDHVRNFIQQTHYIFRFRTTIRSIYFTCFQFHRFRGQRLQLYINSLPSCRFSDADNNHYHFELSASISSDHSKLWRKWITAKRCVCPFHLSCEQSSPFRSCRYLESRLVSAIRRFVARRGVPEIIYSDNATNFGRKFVVNLLHSMRHF